MISSLEIVNFRCFERFEAQGFGRVNLLVGTNNSGKTSLLEAIELWAAEGRPSPIMAALDRRGELLRPGFSARPQTEFAVRHLFHGHGLESGRFFEITGIRDGHRRIIRAAVESRSPIRTERSYEGYRQLSFFGEEGLADTPIDGRLFLTLAMATDAGSSPIAMYGLRLSPEGGLSDRSGIQASRYTDEEFPIEEFPVSLVTTRSLTSVAVARMFGEIVLTEEEPLILSALKTIEPAMERLALAVGDVNYRSGPNGLFIKLAGQPQRIPIGSMGDGVWRMLALTLALVNVRGGILLVDEIDTGLHFSVMTDMWKLVIETAQRLDVQVFATSHSRDCYESLATVLRQMNAPAGTAAIHRIERDKGRTVVFDEQEIIIAAERGTEVR